MPRRSKTQTGTEIILAAMVAVLVVLVAIWNFLVETKLIYVVPIIVVVVIVLYFRSKQKAEKERINKIQSHQNEWGENCVNGL